MKTTVEISDPILDKARHTARSEGATLRGLIEEGLRLALERREKVGPFRLRDETVDGQGLQPEARGLSWSDVLDRSHETSFRDRGA